MKQNQYNNDYCLKSCNNFFSFEKNTQIIPTIFLNNKTPYSYKRITRVILLLSRYIPYISSIRLYRSRLFRKKVFIYFISRQEFNRGRLIRVNERYKHLPLHVNIAKHSLYSMFPSKGAVNFFNGRINDNLIEISRDYRLSESFFQKLKSSKLSLIKKLRLSALQNIQYRDDFIPTRANPPTIVPNNILLGSCKMFAQNSTLVLSDYSLIEDLYNNPLLYKYFL